ncbi:MAG: hypothetical protein ACRCW4_16855 [Candidatus Neomicrothrix subdominans]
MRRVPGRVMVTVALLLVGAPGCGGDSPPSSAAVSSTAASSTRTHGATPNLDASLGIGASVAQYRRDEAVGVVQLKAVAGPDTPPRIVTSAQLRWDGMTPVPPVEVATALTSGRRVDLPAPLGAAACGPLGDVAPGDSPSAPPLGDGVIRLTLDAPGERRGVTRTVDAPLLPSAEAPLRRIFEHDCQRQSMRRAVEVGLSSRWRRSDTGGIPTAEGTLVLTRGATDQPISITSVNGSVLLNLSLADGDPPTMAPGQERLEVPVRVTSSGRCDGHALGGSSQTYTLQAGIEIGGDGDPIGVTVSPDDDGRALFARVIADACDHS